MTTDNIVRDLSRRIIRGGYLDDEINAGNPLVLQFVDAVGDDRDKSIANHKQAPSAERCEMSIKLLATVGLDGNNDNKAWPFTCPICNGPTQWKRSGRGKCYGQLCATHGFVSIRQNPVLATIPCRVSMWQRIKNWISPRSPRNNVPPIDERNTHVES